MLVFPLKFKPDKQLSERLGRKMSGGKNDTKVLGSLHCLNLHEDFKDQFLKGRIIQQSVKCPSNDIILKIFKQEILLGHYLPLNQCLAAI